MYGFSTEQAFEQHQRDVANGFVRRSPDPSEDVTRHESKPIISEYVEMMELMQALAQLKGASKEDARELFEECEYYNELLIKKHAELEESDPVFSEVIDTWVERKLLERPEHLKDSDMEKAVIYDELKDEMYQDYKDYVKLDPDAAAEWQTIERIIDNRIHYHVMKDAGELIRSQFDLAA